MLTTVAGAGDGLARPSQESAMNCRTYLKTVRAAMLALPLAIVCSGLAAEPPQPGSVTDQIEPVHLDQLPAPMARPPVCADPRVTLDHTSMENGIVRLSSTVANRGTLALSVPSTS
jgi:hypothetical protein